MEIKKSNRKERKCEQTSLFTMSLGDYFAQGHRSVHSYSRPHLHEPPNLYTKPRIKSTRLQLYTKPRLKITRLQLCIVDHRGILDCSYILDRLATNNKLKATGDVWG